MHELVRNGWARGRRFFLTAALVTVVFAASTRASAHHEALFGPQSSLAVEASGFVSTQSFVHAYGVNGTQTAETTFIVSGGFSPIAGVPWSFALVQPFTYQTSRVPTPAGSTGPFTACDGCLRRENMLVATQYRFDFTELQKSTGKDGNFALISAALEPPTGNKDYATFHGPFNAIGAAMIGVEWSAFSLVGLGYYRFDARDSTSSKKGDSALLALGFAYTPIDEDDRMLSLQLGFGEELHARDVDHGATIDPSGGWELLLSPTIVGAPMKHLRIFGFVSLPVAQSYRSDAEQDRYRVGAGVIYAFERAPAPTAVFPATQ